MVNSNVGSINAKTKWIDEHDQTVKVTDELYKPTITKVIVDVLIKDNRNHVFECYKSIKNPFTVFSTGKMNQNVLVT